MRPQRSVVGPRSHPQPAWRIAGPADEPSDQLLVGRAHDGNQDASTQLYLRYAGRVTALVKRRCSSELARCAGVEDIVQSVFGSFFQRTGQGHYDFTDCDGMWRMLLVISINRIRTLATYHYAAKRDRHRTIFRSQGSP